ncbi:MAG: alginate lyase family protein, partial [Planctomycetales bacterium]|nr:alginate lyase family protein [Planctomycetales bacterium]
MSLKRILACVCLLSIHICDESAALAADGAKSGRTFLLDPHSLELARANYEAGDPATVNSMRTLISAANRYLDSPTLSVVYGPALAPSGDPHDITSYGPYWWPNPDTEDGLPWVPRDGFVNPDANLDWNQLEELGRAAEAMSLAYYFTGEEKYAEKT